VSEKKGGREEGEEIRRNNPHRYTLYVEKCYSPGASLAYELQK